MSVLPATAELRPIPNAEERERNKRAANRNEFVSIAEQADPAKASDSTAELHSFLERRSRQWSTNVRLLEQHRQLVLSVEAERESEYARLRAIVESAEQSLRAVRAATDPQTENRVFGELEKVLENNRLTLEQLETIAASLNTNFLAWRAAWFQYAQTYEATKKIRMEIDQRTTGRG